MGGGRLNKLGRRERWRLWPVGRPRVALMSDVALGCWANLIRGPAEGKSELRGEVESRPDGDSNRSQVRGWCVYVCVCV